MSDHPTSWDLDSGARVHVWNPAGQARAIVQLQHGFAEHAQRYTDEHAQLIPHLLDRGYGVWAMDMIGHGRSPGPRRLTDIRAAVADHVRVRARLHGEGLPVLLFGHSLGGLVTAGSVATDPAGTAGVVLSAPVLVPPVPAPARAAAMLLARLLPRTPVPGRNAPIDELTRRPDVVERARRDPLMHPGRVPLLVGATALDVSARLWRHAPRWQAPCLVLHGTDDTATDHRQSRRLVDALGTGDKTLHLVDGGRHELLNDLPAERILDLVLTWIDDRVPATRGPLP
ncbi:alpha-beta hydrolase superfamily lysophospholipase [Actinoplanes lutulentus]|uniref:Alpha-beta hydrolase superfamily lysophospholipase n=1 Tax=Actinoplanes lutulentus TaxID=1287878 RepID=A0A327Z324_9ACTN|nr:alpha/beta fold hydrolase [Actinoplanes lutulentus]MBB2943360.1 alpha-beta hydrolase superfamily lysophospholipase [Actinoplanes lutulentus]RAK28418.1 alpha-beta hydrolase superfamily lysophospholipase [Actinoplanes lutulentus]